LDMDGGWLTAEGIAMEVGMHPDNVYRSLFRWRRHGHVESRTVQLAYVGGVNRSGRNKSHLESRQEWKTL